MSFENKALIGEKAPMLRLLVPFVTGILCYDRIGTGLPGLPVLLTMAVFLLITLLGVMNLPLHRHRYKVFYYILVQLLFVLCGITACTLQDQRKAENWLWNKHPGSNAVLAVITEPPTEKAQSIRCTIKILATIDSLAEICSGKALLYIRKPEGTTSVRSGDTVLVPNRWQPVRNAGNPYEFDYVRSCRRKNIFFQQFLSKEELIVHSHNKDKESLLQTVHNYSLNVLNKYIKDSTANALMKAMLLGDEKDIDPDMRQTYTDTGIIHIVSISGAHVALLFLFVSFSLRWIKAPRHQWVRYALSLLLIWFYVLLAGASAPALRAAVMFSILALGNMGKLQANPLNQLCTAAFLMLLYEPMWLFSIGFQLSFVAVLSLLIFYAPLLGFCKPTNKLTSFVAQSIAASVAAEILIAPLVAYYFHSFPLLFIIAGLLAGVSMGVILCLGMTLLLTGPWPTLSNLLAWILIRCSQGFHYGINTLQQLNTPSFKTIYLSFTGLLLLYAFIAALSVCLLQQTKKMAWIAITCLLLFSVLSFCRSWQISRQEQLVVYNAGITGVVDYISGSFYWPLRHSTEKEYILNNAHTGFGANNIRLMNNVHCLQIGNTRVLLLDSNTVLPGIFPVDIVVISSGYKHTSCAIITGQLSPKTIVLTGRQYPQRLEEWQNVCKAQHIALHYTGTDGAFILSDHTAVK